MLNLKNATKDQMVDLYSKVLSMDPNIDAEHLAAFMDAAKEATKAQILSTLTERAEWDRDCYLIITTWPQTPDEPETESEQTETETEQTSEQPAETEQTEPEQSEQTSNKPAEQTSNKPAENKPKKERTKTDTFPSIITMVDGRFFIRSTSNGRRLILFKTDGAGKETVYYLLCRRKVGARVYIHKNVFTDTDLVLLKILFPFAEAGDEGKSYPLAAVLSLAEIDRLLTITVDGLVRTDEQTEAEQPEQTESETSEQPAAK